MSATASASTASRVRAHDLEDLLVEAITLRHPQADRLALRAATNLKRAFNVLHQIEFAHLRGANGLTPAAFRVLFMTWCFDSIGATEITRLSAISRQGVSACLSNLERDGLIKRSRSGVDRRQTPIRITPAGASLVEQHLLPQNDLHHAYFDVLTRDEVRMLTDLLSRLVVGARTVPDPR